MKKIKNPLRKKTIKGMHVNAGKEIFNLFKTWAVAK